MRSTLKLDASISDSQIGGLRTMLAGDQKWGVPDDNSKTTFVGHEPLMVRSILELNASTSDSKIGGLRSMLAEDQKWGRPGRWFKKCSFWPRTFDLEAVELYFC